MVTLISRTFSGSVTITDIQHSADGKTSRLSLPDCRVTIVK